MTEPDADPSEQPFVIVPTIDGYLALERRVKALEQYRETVAEAELDAEPTDSARLDRHRQEIDDLKNRYNSLVRLVQLHLAPSVPTTPESPL